MPEFSTPHLEEFYNHVHDGATGRFSGRAASGREGFREGSPSRKGNAQTHLSPESQKHSPYNLNFTKRAGQPSRHGHGGPANRVDPLNRLQTQKGGASVARATLPKSLGFRHATKNSTAYVHTAGNITPKSGPRDGRTVTYSRSKDGKVKFGGPKIEAKLPLRNATTGRLNPRPARAAFKQGTDEIIGKKQDSKRTTLTGPKVRTVKTYKGRRIGHVSSKGGADRAGFREGG